MRGAVLGPAGLLLCLAVPAASQVAAQLDLGMGGASLAGLGMTSLWSVAPDVRWEPGHFRFAVNGEFREFGTAGQSLLGTASASWFVPVTGPLLLEANGTAEGRAGAGVPDAGTWDGGLRAHLRGAATGGWLGLRGGRDRFGTLDRWEAGLWRHVGRISLQLQGRRTAGGAAVGTSPFFDGAADTLSRVDSSSQTRIRITTDLGAWVSWDGGRLQLRGGVGWRVGQAEPANSLGMADGTSPGGSSRYNWWSAEGTWWLSERVGFTGAVGTQPANPSLLVPSGGFMRLSVRVALDRHVARSTLEPPPSAPGLETRRDGPEVEFTLDAPLAMTVEVMADFTDWLPMAMARQSATRWRIRLPAEPGVHYLNVRYDGGNWQPPPRARVVRDEFGKETGVLLID